jgi:hypothetical protein
MAEHVTHSRLLELLEYDQFSGQFRWRVWLNGFVKIGDVAGYPTSRGYIAIQIDGRAYQAHNLAWLYMTGEWPDPEVDHHDLDGANNAWSNLRKATRTQQCANRRTQRNNKSGAKGVSLHKATGKYIAQIGINGKRKHLGLFETIQEAAGAYEKAAIEAFGEFARTA